MTEREMKTYKVTGTYNLEFAMLVSAESEERAREIAWELVEDDHEILDCATKKTVELSAEEEIRAKPLEATS